MISRELLLAKVSILGAEYVEDQLAGGPSHDPRLRGEYQSNKVQQEQAIAENFERAGQPDHTASPTLTSAQAFRHKHQNFSAVSNLSTQFGGRIVDVSENSIIVELTAKTARVEAFLSLLKPFGLLEVARTGTFLSLCVKQVDLLCSPGVMAMPRTPITASPEDSEIAPEMAAAIDPSLLPPG